MKKITTKQDLIKIINDDKLFSKYQLSFYYNFEKTVDVKLLDDYEVMEIIIKRDNHKFCFSLLNADYKKLVILLHQL